jgi:hypothetical protein
MNPLLKQRGGDAFGFLDRELRPGPSQTRSQRETLLRSIASELRLLHLPGHTPSRWRIDANAMTPTELAREIRIRVRYARRRGVDARDHFSIDAKKLVDRAKRLAERLHQLRGKDPHIASLPCDEDLISVIGLPNIDVVMVKKWFMQRLTRHARQCVDYLSHLAGDIGKYGSPIVSERVLDSRTDQLEFQAAFARTHVMVSDSNDGGRDIVPFAAAAASARKRASKCYVQLKGLQEMCSALGLAGFFVTLTLPASFHPNPSNGRKSWDGATPREAHNELQARWRSLQRRMNENGGKFYGVRVEEPHEDGCPHWHALLYIQPHREVDLRRRIAAIFGNGIAADVEPIDPLKGSGASYLMKYILPWYIDLPDSLDRSCEQAPQEKSAKARRYDAHRATWGGRSIQFFDVPGSSTVWDQLRRIQPKSEAYSLLGDAGQQLHHAATTNDYGGFLLLLMGLRSNKTPVKVLYRHGVAAGIVINDQEIWTKTRSWRIEASSAVANAPAKRRDGNVSQSPDSYP